MEKDHVKLELPRERSVNERKLLTYPSFAYDFASFGFGDINVKKLKPMLEELIKECVEVGLKINIHICVV